MTRGNARELALHLIYSWEFTGDDPDLVVKTRLEETYYSCLAQENDIYSERPSKKQISYIDGVVAGISAHLEELNSIIGSYSIGWDVNRISRLARAVMQLAIYEILYVDDVPDGVAASEAVRLAKKYDGDDTGSFVNGIIGAYLRAKNAPATEEV